jgi:hypothetical protein
MLDFELVIDTYTNPSVLSYCWNFDDAEVLAEAQVVALEKLIASHKSMLAFYERQVVEHEASDEIALAGYYRNDVKARQQHINSLSRRLARTSASLAKIRAIKAEKEAEFQAHMAESKARRQAEAAAVTA